MTNQSSMQSLGDFTTDSRVVTLTLMAAVVGVVSAFVALALVRLIGLFTHLFYYHEIAGSLVSPAQHRLGPAAVLIPMAGGLIVGLLADAIDYSGAIALVAGLTAASGLWVAFDLPGRPRPRAGRGQPDRGNAGRRQWPYYGQASC